VATSGREGDGLGQRPGGEPLAVEINACTNAQAVDVKPVLPLLTADGGLPPLP
jgi:hypothetical protein